MGVNYFLTGTSVPSSFLCCLTSLQFCLTFLVLGSITSRPSLSLTSTQIRLVSFGGSVANAGCASVKHNPATNIIFFIVIFLDSIQA